MYFDEFARHFTERKNTDQEVKKKKHKEENWLVLTDFYIISVCTTLNSLWAFFSFLLYFDVW